MLLLLLLGLLFGSNLLFLFFFNLISIINLLFLFFNLLFLYLPLSALRGQYLFARLFGFCRALFLKWLLNGRLRKFLFLLLFNFLLWSIFLLRFFNLLDDRFFDYCLFRLFLLLLNGSSRRLFLFLLIILGSNFLFRALHHISYGDQIFILLLCFNLSRLHFLILFILKLRLFMHISSPAERGHLSMSLALVLAYLEH